MKIETAALRAALEIKAVKEERHLLNGIYLTPDRQLWATDRRILLMVRDCIKLEEKEIMPDNLVLNMYFRPPLWPYNNHYCEYKHVLHRLTYGTHEAHVTIVPPCGAKFPDLRKYRPGALGLSKTMLSEFGIDWSTWDKLYKAFPGCGFRFEFYNENTLMRAVPIPQGHVYSRAEDFCDRVEMYVAPARW